MSARSYGCDTTLATLPLRGPLGRLDTMGQLAHHTNLLADACPDARGQGSTAETTSKSCPTFSSSALGKVSHGIVCLQWTRLVSGLLTVDCCRASWRENNHSVGPLTAPDWSLVHSCFSSTVRVQELQL